MEYPLFGFCDGDLSVLVDLAEARAEIEPPDVKASSWHVYDRKGQRIAVNVVQRPLFTYWPLSWLTIDSVDLVDTGVLDRETMESELRVNLDAIPEDKLGCSKEFIKRATFDELVELASRNRNLF